MAADVSTDATASLESSWLQPTWFIDSDADEIGELVDRVTDGLDDPMERAIALFYAVRDGIRYDPYVIDYSPEAFRASTIAGEPTGWCVSKSVLLCAAARRAGIPARLGFADVRNHLTSEKLLATMGTDLFAWHGYAELLLPDPDRPGEQRWFKLSTAFNIELCERFGVKTLEFDGTGDALMHPFDEAGRRHMEYVNQRGSYVDLPLEEIKSTFAEVYGTAFGDASPGDDPAFS